MKALMSEQFVFGMHAVFAVLTNPHRSIHKLIVSQERMDARVQELLKKAEQKNIPMERLSIQKMNQRFADFAHQGVVASVSALPQYSESDLVALIQNTKAAPLILVLDGVTDPHNLGACLRSADAAGVDFVLIPKDKSASMTPVVSKVASGAAESVPLVRVTNLVRALDLMKQQGVWIYGAAAQASSSLYQINCTGPTALVLGSEAEGLRRLTRAHCDDLFSLPMLGSVESLNVSVACGVSLYEVVRQRI
jgi:23S rRNA (guanosine2251-2'-O)-methyltransferase